MADVENGGHPLAGVRIDSDAESRSAPTDTSSAAVGLGMPLVRSQDELDADVAVAEQEVDVEDESRVGFVHSTETTSGVNGPGLRYTVFLSGCALRCQYCHNPDTQGMRLGERTTAKRVIDEAGRYRAFISRGGGLTVTGGEPLLQPRFVEELFVRAKRDLGLHTTLDSSAHNGRRATNTLLANTDLVLLDIKAGNPELYRRVSGGGRLSDVMDFAARLVEHEVAVWVRFVLVPGLTDDPEHVAQVATLSRDLGDIVKRVEVLPYHRLGVDKYAALEREYPLPNTPTPTHAQVDAALAIFREHGLLALA